VKGGKEVRGQARPSPAKPLNCGQDPISAAVAYHHSPVRGSPGRAGRLGAALPGLGALQPTRGRRGPGITTKPGGMTGTERDLMQMKGSARLQETLPLEKTPTNLSLFRPYGANALSRLSALHGRHSGAGKPASPRESSPFPPASLDPENSMVKKTREVDYSHD